jgi:hypothetical protein
LFSAASGKSSLVSEYVTAGTANFELEIHNRLLSCRAKNISKTLVHKANVSEGKDVIVGDTFR